MLQVSLIREEKEKVIHGLKKRRLQKVEESVEGVLNLDLKRRQTQQQQDALLSEANSIAREIGNLMKAGQKADAEALKAKTVQMKKQLAELGPELTKTEDELQRALYALPNIPAAKVPEGSGADDNVKVYEAGNAPALPPNALPHWE